MPGLVYNERSWAIDLISEINAYCAPLNREIVKARGELTLSGEANSMFPDVLLYGVLGYGLVRHGWELKMPDTSISDVELLDNAKEKAKRLQVNSFLVWNVTTAVLHVDQGNGVFAPIKTWGPLSIVRRDEVQAGEGEWKALLIEIIDDLNEYFASGTLQSATPVQAMSDELLADFVATYQGLVASKILDASNASATFEAELNNWWLLNKVEHPNTPKEEALSKCNLTNWLNRFLFAHYLKQFNSDARQVESIDDSKSLYEAIDIFEDITNRCDFMQVFSSSIGDKYIEGEAWNALIAFNMFLTDLRLDGVPQEQLHGAMERLLNGARRKIAGQYATPKALAEFLVRITVEEREGHVLDPCCGTGTIGRAAYDLKCTRGISVHDALKTTWVSDKFQFPLQLCTIALSDPQAMGETVKVFRKDAFELRPGISLQFANPNDGSMVEDVLPSVKAVVSNLPFVRFESLLGVNPMASVCAQEIEEELGTGRGLDGRSDVFAYLIMHFRHLIESHGRVGVIISNAWLGTNWGRLFRDALTSFFSFRIVVISAAGRWFQNADIVTTLLVLEKCDETAPDDKVRFITTRIPQSSWDTDLITKMTTETLVDEGSLDTITKYCYRMDEIKDLEHKGFGWQSLFAGLGWVASISASLVPVSNYFNVARGERRGWNELFYPPPSHDIEPEYIRPVLKRARTIEGLIARPNEEAFCCSDTLDELRRNGKRGALEWIQRFEHGTNTNGEPLVETLARSGHHWYEMKSETQADFVLLMNPDRRLFVAKMATRGFVDQRMIRFTVHADALVDMELCHALMNCTLSMFMIESAGFGRGLGVLDLNAKKLKRSFHMLDPSILSAEQKHEILTAFAPLLERQIENVERELELADRLHFDEIVLRAFGYEELLDEIRNALLVLHGIRQTVK